MPPLNQIKKKAVLVYKPRVDYDLVIDEKNMRKEICVMEMKRSVLENLSVICKEVFMPILSNPENQKDWSELVSKDLMDKFNHFLAQVYVTLGQVKGRTLLPLPPSDATSFESKSSKDKAHILESSIITWTRQIKNVLKQDPESALKSGNNPDPLTEIEFWKNKAENLNSIYKQLQSEKIKKVLKFLEQNKSTYTGPFGKLQKDVQTARTEANDNYKYLVTLKGLFESLTDETADFSRLPELFFPIMHTILLIWKNSTYYNTPSKLVVLIREICNAIISQAFKFINGEQIFAHIKAEEPKEANDKLTQTLEVCSKFKEAYFVYKAKADNEWKITTNALFVRLDAFAERCQDIIHLTSTIIQFNKLAKIEIGGTKGKTLTETVQGILKEFEYVVEKFQEVEYDIMDISIKKFDDDFYVFRSRIKELERRLASTLTQGFDDCDTIQGKFKLLESFEGLLTRPIIQDELEKKHIILLELYKNDLKVVQNIFHEGKALVDKVDERAPIGNNMPPIAGAIYWTTGLYERIKEPMEKLSTLSQSIQDREEFKDIQKLYSSICKNLKEFEEQKIKAWEQSVEEHTEENLSKNLLVYDEEGQQALLTVNFDRMLIRLLREVKYLRLLNYQVPEKAQRLYNQVDIYRTQTGNLDLIVGMYNEILSTLLPVEKPLLKERIELIDKILKPGIENLKWNDQNIDPFIKEAMAHITDVNDLVKKMKENVKKMKKMTEGWCKPLYDRKNKPMSPDDLEQTHSASVDQRLGMIKDDGKEINKLLKDTMDHVKPAKKSTEWLAYQDYINCVIIDGITKAIVSSIHHLSDQISIEYNRHNDLQPMFDVKVCLGDNEAQFEPPIRSSPNENGIKDIIFRIVEGFISIASLVQRLDGQQLDYLVEIKDQMSVFYAISLISKNMKQMEDETDKFLQKYDDLSFLWKEDIETSFQEFLDSAGEMPKHMKPVEGGEDGEMEEDESYKWMVEKILKGITVHKPTLEAFDEKITYLTSISTKIHEMETPTTRGWLKINSQPLKDALNGIITSWINKYTKFLLENTVTEIKNLISFTKEVAEGIQKVPEKVKSQEEKDLLMKVMTHLRDVKMIKDHALAEINPMKETVQLLKKHGVHADEDLLLKIENSKTSLVEVSEKALGPVKEQILPLQTTEGANIKKNLDEFSIKVKKFREEFQKNCPYHVKESTNETIDKAYETISEYYAKTVELELQAKRYNDLETLFELQKSGYNELKECKNELKSLKYMWDLIQLVHYQFNAWKLTLWDKIDTDFLLAQIKELQKKQVNPVNPINKDIKSWGAFSALNERVKNMAVILPLISDLHSKSMMNRHWRKLMAITGKNIAFSSPKFCLEDLIQLELYKFSDEVNELVDSANKEARIETNLGKIANIWEEQKLNFAEYKGCYIIGALDETIEFVDDHSMQLMGMMSQKDVEEFKETVFEWQRKLKAVDTVLGIWIKVQKNWQRLETIFLASEDIKAQLPEDTKRFQKVDTDWREMMIEANEDLSVINACNHEGREERLFEMHSEIELCEKSLNNYLEQKKKVFSRFYFVSNQALLDILSNGNNPEIVDGYLGDCFSGMRSVKFIETEQRPYRSCEGMYSKEGEYVPFEQVFEFQGAVENYLCDLETKVMRVLRNIAEAARATAESWDLENKRHYWLEDYNAQIALLITQIVWTEEVNRAFEELESGGEAAMKNYLVEIKNRIGFLIARVREDLSMELRIKIITIITIDVHERDVVSSFVDRKIDDMGSFAWQCQLKFYWRKEQGDDNKHCYAEICDYKTKYSYEYVGNCGRLVITPLTDRCYITLTQALNLTMGGAPAGPAGTGKTETVKDLGRALGLLVVVFNCSDQMNYESMAQIFLGLSQSGAWGCFDEFNRISIEVLSVVSTQVKTVLDALKECTKNPAKTMFNFQDDEVRLRTTVGFFITMNPGYAGRTELPENLKALFRSCAMVVPDIILICENMLMSEGFINAKELSEKFMTLYTLCKSLLSIQIHYDWGLRAVKSVLRQAGGLKREEPNAPEQRILMRALRDFNLPKIVSYDRNIFMGLINDLFPNIVVESKTNPTLKEAVQEMTLKNKKQAEEAFVLKCVQFYEILQVRHCMFIIGKAGSAKTTIWKVLSDALNHLGQKTVYEFADPKAVTSDELFGCMNPKTKEWKDGVLSTIMRDMNRNNGRFTADQTYKWIILDGDVDPEWIESLNTVMDDNKMLTLVSQERIPLTPEMRMILEVSHLNNATPATVSRGGVLFINDTDVGWRPYIDSWMDRLKDNGDNNARTVFYLAISHYMSEDILEVILNMSTITPCVTIAYVQTLCCIIDALYAELHERKEYAALMKKLKSENDDEYIKRIYEAYFIYAFMWSFGGACDDDSYISFNSIIKNKAKIKFPDQGLCYDFFFDPLANDWVNWEDKVPAYEARYDQLYQNIVVPTADTIKHKTILGLHVKQRKAVLYVGSAGTGKTTIIKDYFLNVDKETTVVASINFNSYTDSRDLQAVMESNVDKRAGSTFGPPPNHVLIYFMDDINMPLVDKYGTQSPICLIRQLIDYGIVFDRDHLEEKKKLVDCLYTACMNPKAGSFFIDLRLQRHYSVFACLTTSADVLKTIYGQLLSSHFQHFDANISTLAPKFVEAITTVFNGIVKTPLFFPSAKKFHYQFNLRDFSKIVQNILLAEPQLYRNQPDKLYRLWLHECHRVYLDRLLFEEDVAAYMKFVNEAGKKFDIKEDQLYQEPIIYTSFISACQGHEKAYLGCEDLEVLKKVLEDKLHEYNDSNAAMDLVLFQQAMEHICRISRIIDQPCGNALLIGVGGSGKQSLAKLASFILGYDVYRIMVSTNYSINDLKEDIRTMYTKAGVTGIQLLFLLTDSQIVNEKFLVFINDMLSSGWVPDLFPKDEFDGILGKIRTEAKSANYGDSPDQLFEFFLDKCKKNLHIGLCFSPVGDLFRIRARRFPGIINCTQIDWFHEWPKEALIGVAGRFLKEVDIPTEEIRDAVALNMAECHLSIAQANKDFLARERRYNYTTPTSFLELIKFYKSLFKLKVDRIADNISRLETGLSTMKSTTEQVEGLKEKLEIKMVDVKKQEEETNALIEIVGKESLIAEEEQKLANIEQDKTTALANEAKRIKDEADVKLSEAIPAMKAAEEAVNCLNKTSIQELKSLPKPPAECVDVTTTVLMLRGEKKNYSWQNAQKMMNNPQKFIDEIRAFDGRDIDEGILAKIAPIKAQPFFNYDVMKGKSTAAAFLCLYVNNIITFNTIYKNVKPLMDSAEAAEKQKKEAEASLKIVIDKVNAINAQVDELKAKLDEAETTKAQVLAEAQALQNQLDLAERLVGGLADENERWGESVKTLSNDKLTMIGDALLSAEFVSYIAPFNSQFRDWLWKELWLPDIILKKIPMTEGVDPLAVLATPAEQAGWKNEGLPSDRVSLENAAVIVSCSRWPLIIDPQLQGQKWIRGREGSALNTLQLSQKGWMKKVEFAVTNGQTLLIEGIGQELDSVLDPLLSRSIIKRGRNNYVLKLGAEEIEYNPEFKLYIQTKLSNPHYKPEIAAQCTIINFIVTEGGLEDQLLASVVRVEKPDLEQTKEELVNKQNMFQIELAKLEEELLFNLSNADPSTILTNTALIESLEKTKKTSKEIKEQQIIAKETEKQINISREIYRRVAAEGAMLYFLLIQLYIVDHMYQYSLESFNTFFFRAFEKTPSFDTDEKRVLELREQIRTTIYQWVSRGLFERHKQIFLCQITFRLMQKKILEVDYTAQEFNFLIQCPIKTEVPNPLKKEWLPDLAWYSIQKLIEIEGFESFAQNLEKESPTRFKQWYDELQPENEKLPLDWKKLETMPFQKLLVLRCLRPDRLTIALDNFNRRILPHGSKYVDMDSTSSFQDILVSSLGESTTTTPIFFILSPGANPVKEIEKIGPTMGIDMNKQFHNVALGQGQDVIAMNKLEVSHKEGHWVMLQNIHLMPKWLLELEKKLDEFALEGSHPSFRLFLSAEPSDAIPIGILERSIKLTNEPPQGLKPNMKRAFTFFSKEEIEDMDAKIKTILFALCYYHSVVIERRKFGPKGWNMSYPFSMGDLRDSAIVLKNYMERNAASGKVPWDDLRYIFGEIMYGGHIVDDWDRRLNKSYLENLMKDNLLDEAELFPFVEGKNVSFKCPGSLSYGKYIEHIEESLQAETPLAFGMHPNAEIDFRTTQCNVLFKTLVELQPKDAGDDESGGGNVKIEKTEELIKTIDELQLDQSKPNMDDIVAKLGEDRDPFQNVFLQECEYMSVLIEAILKSLSDLGLAFKGELTMTDQMEELMDSVYLDRVPAKWAKLAFPSTRGLASWLINLKHRLDQLSIFRDDPSTQMKIVFLNRLKNPQSFLTAVRQKSSRDNGYELDKLYIQTDVTKKMHNELEGMPKDGAYVFGFHVEGARWEAGVGQLEESAPKVQFSVVPVINVKAAMVQKEMKEDKGVYKCPTYMTTARGNTYVFEAQLKTKHPPQKWIIAGVAMILDVEGVADAYTLDKD